MAATVIAADTNTTQGQDLFEFNTWFKASIMETKKTDKLLNSGIIAYNDELAGKMAAGGMVVEVPYWKDLAAGATDSGFNQQVSTDKTTDVATPNTISMIQAQTPYLRRNFGLSSADLSAAIEGEDPMGIMVQRVEPSWSRIRQEILKSVLSGILRTGMTIDSTNMFFKYADATTPTNITSESILEAEAMLGEYSDDVTVMMVSPTQMLQLKKANLIDYVPDSDGKVDIATYLGKRVIVTNDLITFNGAGDSAYGASTTQKSYMAVLFRPGAIQYAETMAKTPVETERQAAQGAGEGVENMWFRRHMCFHPVGFSYDPGESKGFDTKGRGLSAAKASPSNAELAAATAWSAIAEERAQVPFVGLLTN